MLPVAAMRRQVDPGRGTGFDHARPARDNATAGMPHLVHADFRDLHDQVACPRPSTARFRPVIHISQNGVTPEHAGALTARRYRAIDLIRTRFGRNRWYGTVTCEFAVQES
jgi:hypothetical protein